MNEEDFLLSFGDDTIAAINQLEISRLICDVSPKHATELNSIVDISQRQTHCNKSLTFEQSVKCDNNSISQRDISITTSSELCTQEKCDLATWGLPSSVLEQYQNKGIKSMFEWQVQCLGDAGVLEGKNLVYSAPTSAGKTLVAEMLIIKTVLEKKKKAIIILPFVSVVREKMFYFQDLLETSGIRVHGLMGSQNLQGGFKGVDIAVCTMEKANSLINRLMEEGSLHLIGVIVIDELHLLGDPFRGYLLELLITKIRYMSQLNEDINIQIVGMSATLPNLDLLALWLDARLYKTDFRPIPLYEYLKVGTTLYTKELKTERTVELKYDIQDDPDNVVHLCLETIFNGHSALIFCPTKNWCEKLAITIAKELYNIGKGDSEIGLQLRKQLNSSAIEEALEQLKACPVGLDSSLAKSISFGAAFHHAGLTIEERDIIEGLFRSGIVRVLVATSTLSSGVNLPARRVIIRTPIFHRKPLDVQVYQQMIGRAGRMGRDTEGESILLCSNADKKVGEQLIQEKLKPVTSCLGYGELSSSLKRAILEVIASGVAETPEQVQCYTNCTLLAASHTGLENPIESCITFLVDNEFVRLQMDDDGSKKYVATPLGNACLSASISPDDGLELFQELQKARQCFVLENELHLIYLVTPYSVSAQWSNLDWLQIMNLWEKLPPSMRRVGDLIGIDESFMVRALRGTVNLNNYKQLHKLSVHRRFYTALALQELVDEIPLVEVAAKFQCSKGMLQSLQQTSASFAGMVTAFCRRLGWRNLELLVSQFQDRLQFGVHRELCELMRLDSLNGPRARALFNVGITSLGDLASADANQVENALHKSVTFQSSKKMDGETAYDAAVRNQFKTVWITGRQGLTEREAARYLIKEAQLLLQQELGLMDVKWGRNEDTEAGNDDDSSVLKELDAEKSSQKDKDTNSSVELLPENESKCNSINVEMITSIHTEGINKNLEYKSHNVTEESKSVVTNNEDSINLKANDANCSENVSDVAENEESKHKLVSNKVECKPIENNNNKDIGCKLNDTIEESQSIDDENDMEMLIEDDPISSPVSDIFESSLENKCDNELGFCESTSVQRIDSSEHFNSNSCTSISTPTTTSIQKTLDLRTFSTPNVSFTENISLNSVETNEKKVNSSSALTFAKSDSFQTEESNAQQNTLSQYFQSRFSVDIFSTPIATESCESPTLFEDSLVIDSRLCNMLDMCSSKTVGGCKKSAAQDSEEKSNVDTVDQKFLKEASKDDILITYEKKMKSTICDSTPNSLAQMNCKNSAPDVENCLNADESVKLSNICQPSKLTTVNFAKEKDNVEEAPNLQRDKELLKDFHPKVQDLGKSVKESQNKGHISSTTAHTSLHDEALTESFFQQAFDTMFDFSMSNKSCISKEHSNIAVPENSDYSGKEVRNTSNLVRGAGNQTKNPFVEILSKSHVSDLSKRSKMLLNADQREKNINNTTFVVGKVGKFDEKQVLKTKLSFISDSDEEGDDLVPSSQSSDSISCIGVKTCPVKNKISKNEKFPVVKRQKLDVKPDEKKPLPKGKDVKLKIESNTSWEFFQIIDLCSQRQTFEQFKNDLSSYSHVSFSVACDNYVKKSPRSCIGNKIIGRQSKKEDNSPKLVVSEKFNVIGLALCVGEKLAYYIALDPAAKGSSSQTTVTFSEQLQLIERIMSHEDSYFLSAYDVKEQYKILHQSCSIRLEKDFCDPKVAEWMLDPENSEKNLQSMMSKYVPSSIKLFKRVGNIVGPYSLGLHVKSQVNARIRSCVEAIATWHTTTAQIKCLEKNKLLKMFKETEMPTILCLAHMEINGIGFNKEEIENLYSEIHEQLSSLEQTAFKLAGHYFSLSSRNDVSKVLFKELQLKCNKFTSAHKLSTSKDVLIKLKKEHPLPSVILEWRKIHFIMSKVILPFLKTDVSDRIFGHYITDTATGRIHMHEPNLQSIPRNFEITCEGEGKTVSIRHAFIPKAGKSFVSADYSQLELRLLAHLSQDKMLIDIFKKDQDVFRSVAASWNNIKEIEVTDNLRQRAKQVCYGVIYGIGAKALSEQLEVTEEEAALFMETFLNAYPGLKKYRQEVINQCREKGYVETLFGRKRYLPSIKSPKPQLRAQAERQAVNTTVQGSAADIAKTGMVLVEASLKAAFPNEQIRIRRLRENKRQCIETTSATLVLHLHDELLYEVLDKYVDDVISIVKGCMETSANLTVPLPVKIKRGKSWGSLVEIS